MTPRLVHEDGRVALWHGNCRDVLPTLSACSVDAVVCDPPYELGFMGRVWDASGIAYDVAMWAECLRVLKPGGHLLAFGGTRTSHRLTCAIEDAGFEIRDTITWLYGSGFPKSLDVAKAIDKAAGAEREVVGQRTDHDITRNGYASRLGNITRDVHAGPATAEAARWDGWGTALKPASEPIVVARKPLAGTVAQTVFTYGTGALNIDACRVTTTDALVTFDRVAGDRSREDWRTGTGVNRRQKNGGGRWPSNVVLTHAQGPDGGDACAAGCVPGCPVAELDAQSGVLSTHGGGTPGARRGDTQDWRFQAGTTVADSGGASRFFSTFRYETKADTAQRPRAGMVAHPTVKPLALMRWLVRLVTRPGGVVLDPFAGSGTTGEAARLEGARAVLIEQEDDYLPLILDRLTRRTDPVAHLAAKAARGEDVDLGLFADLEGGRP
jgi:DNA modification methylase